MKKTVSKKELNEIINSMKLDFKFCIQNIEYREKVINLLENSIKNNIEKYRNYNIIDSHTMINDFIKIDSIYSLSYTIYSDAEVVRDKKGDIKKVNYIPFAGVCSIDTYNGNYFNNRYDLNNNSFIKMKYKYAVRNTNINIYEA